MHPRKSYRKKLKKEEISAPANFEHRIHAGFNPHTGQYTGLPKQWEALLGRGPAGAPRPKPLADPSTYSSTEVAMLKTVVRGDSMNNRHFLNHSHAQSASHSSANTSRVMSPYGPMSPLPKPDRKYPFGEKEYAPLPLVNRVTVIDGRPMPKIEKPKIIASPNSASMSSTSTSAASDREGNKYATPTTLCYEQFRMALSSVVCPKILQGDLIDVQKIADGSTGTVDTALLKGSGRRVAIKKMNLRKQARRELLFNEVCIMRDYRHPNIVEMLSSSVVQDELWVVMEFMEGGSLTEVVTTCRMFEPQIACIAMQCLRGLSYLHSHGVIHRDIKSDSILLRTDGTAKISDFGFCGQLSTEFPKRRSLVGTPYWTSPEVIVRAPYDTSADVWSFGILIIEMVEGEPPLFNEEPMTALQIIRDSPAPRLNPATNCSEALIDFTSRCLVREPELRWSCDRLLAHEFLLTVAPKESLMPIIKAAGFRQL